MWLSERINHQRRVQGASRLHHFFFSGGRYMFPGKSGLIVESPLPIVVLNLLAMNCSQSIAYTPEAIGGVSEPS
jgi:hypothetical protein